VKRKGKNETQRRRKMRKIILVALSIVFLLTSVIWAAEKEKIAVAADGKTEAAKVSAVAARAPYFLIFDGSGKLLEAVANPYKEAKGGAGTSVVPFLAQKGVTIVVAGEFGANMTQAMKAKGIKEVIFKGTAEEAVKKFLEEKK